MAKRDYYDVLGVSRGAKSDEIRSAYRRQARKYHPDVNKAPEAAEKFREATEAYEVLSDPQKRATYDQFGHAGPGGPFAGAPGRAAAPRGGGVHIDFGELFGGMGGSGFMNMGLDEILDALRGGRAGKRARAARAQPQRGSDAETHVMLDFLEAVRGTTARLRLSVPGGAEGRGETLDVRIPPGVKEGSRIRVRGKGQPGPAGPGDLYLVVHVRPHPYFRREGDDIHVTVPIGLAEAALGAKVEVPTIDGMTMVTVPPGTRSSRKLRLRGRGVAGAGGQRGDQYVAIEIVPPAALSDRQRQLLEDFARSGPPDPRAEVPWK